jgi:FlaG/FlaF family flagellin (archaellin)
MARAAARAHIESMQTFLVIAIVIALLAVVATLGMGIIQMAKGNDPHRSNRLMQQRVILQGIAIALVGILLYLIKS